MWKKGLLRAVSSHSARCSQTYPPEVHDSFDHVSRSRTNDVGKWYRSDVMKRIAALIIGGILPLSCLNL